MALTTASEMADYFIYVANETGSYLSNLKLQKLLYYAQAWHLTLYEVPLFEEDLKRGYMALPYLLCMNNIKHLDGNLC